MTRPGRAAAIAVAITALAAACSSGAPTTAPTAPPTTSPSVAATPTPTPTRTPTTRCPSRYLPPDPDRPVVRLHFRVPEDRRTIAGREQVTFTPDRSVRQIVLRLWGNAPRPTEAGADMRITSVDATGMRDYELVSERTLLRIRLDRRVPAGTSLDVTIRFTFRLPVGANDRFGVRDDAAWWGSGFPLLSYVRGRGFATEPATALFAEAATSEEFRLAELVVDAPRGDTVLATGVPDGGPGALGADRRRWAFTADSARDVAVAVGDFRLARARARGVPILVGVARSLADDPATLAATMADAVRAHAARFGPFPYPHLSVPVVPDLGGGVEFPGLIFMGAGQGEDATASHEVAHEYFYGLVGDNQARDPWLDEAFATYAEGLHRGTAASYQRSEPPSGGRNRVGAPMTYWATQGSATYFRSVYLQGAAALLDARAAAGPARFDRAIRCYIAANAHRVARPADLARALERLPAATRILRAAGALPDR